MITIRKATLSDIPAIYGLVVELAVFEKEPEAVTARLADYESAYEEGLIRVHVAEDDGAVVGMTVTYMTFSTWKGKMLYLEDFYVKATHRSQGVGQQLFDAYITEAKNLECSMVKWQVLDWNTEAIRFYERNEATIEKQWYNGKIIF